MSNGDMKGQDFLEGLSGINLQALNDALGGNILQGLNLDALRNLANVQVHNNGTRFQVTMNGVPIVDFNIGELQSMNVRKAGEQSE